MFKTKLVVHDEQDRIVGWVRNFGCENDHCTTAVINGKTWHAIPAFGTHASWQEYHFRSLEDAVRFVQGEAVKHG